LNVSVSITVRVPVLVVEVSTVLVLVVSDCIVPVVVAPVSVTDSELSVTVERVVKLVLRGDAKVVVLIPATEPVVVVVVVNVLVFTGDPVDVVVVEVTTV